MKAPNQAMSGTLRYQIRDRSVPLLRRSRAYFLISFRLNSNFTLMRLRIRSPTMHPLVIDYPEAVRLLGLLHPTHWARREMMALHQEYIDPTIGCQHRSCRERRLHVGVIATLLPGIIRGQAPGEA